MATRARASIADLRATRGKAELVGGELVVMSPTGYKPGRAAAKVLASLLRHEGAHGGGRALGGRRPAVVVAQVPRGEQRDGDRRRDVHRELGPGDLSHRARRYVRAPHERRTRGEKGAERSARECGPGAAAIPEERGPGGA